MLAAERHYQRVRSIPDELSQDHQQSRSGFADLKLYRVDRVNQAVPESHAKGVIFERRYGSDDCP